MTPYPKRLIEVDLPIKKISEHARREKSIRHGHISTLHIWWARRPLAACRAVICAALWPDPADQLCPEKFRRDAAALMKRFFDQMGTDGRDFNDPMVLRGALLDFIADFANWDNSTKKEYLETSRALTQSAHEALGGAPGTKPLVVDPFAGGGSIPLEALRVGADATGFEEDARLTAMWLWTLSTGTNGNGIKETENEADDDENTESSEKNPKISGYVLEYDAARKIAQGLGAHLEQLTKLVEIKGDKARLLPIEERTAYLFGKEDIQAPKSHKKKEARQLTLTGVLDEVEEESVGWGDMKAPPAGTTVLDRVHQAMILFAAGRNDALKRFLVEDGIGRDERFWRLAQAFSALYPAGTDEKRWVEGLMARKKGLGY